MKIDTRTLVAIGLTLVVGGGSLLISNQLIGLPLFAVGFGIFCYLYVKFNESDPS
jgi:hypothetical protein